MRGSTPKATRTRHKILEAAVLVLQREGHGGFSLGKVADQAGMYQGHVTYYFPSRTDLLVELSEHLVAIYTGVFEQVLAEVDPRRPDWAENFLRTLIDDAVSPGTVSLFPELWSLANADPRIATAVTGLYDHAIASLIRVLGHDPDDPACEELRAVLGLAAVMVEGCTAVHGHRAPEAPAFTTTREMAIGILAPRLRAAQAAAGRLVGSTH